MAFFNEVTKQVVFDELDKESAWAQAPIILDGDPKRYRVCLYCQFPLDYDDYASTIDEKKEGNLSWTIDLINLKKGLKPTNFLAIHLACFGSRQNDNETHRLKRYQKTKWMMPAFEEA